MPAIVPGLPPRPAHDLKVIIGPMRPDLLIRDARRAAGLTQAELAARLGISQSAIAKLEREGSNPTVETLDRVLRAHGPPPPAHRARVGHGGRRARPVHRCRPRRPPSRADPCRAHHRRWSGCTLTRARSRQPARAPAPSAADHARRRGIRADQAAATAGRAAAWTSSSSAASPSSPRPRPLHQGSRHLLRDRRGEPRGARQRTRRGARLARRRRRASVRPDGRTLRRTQILTLTSPEGDIDLLVAARRLPAYAELKANADRIEFDGFQSSSRRSTTSSR